MSDAGAAHLMSRSADRRPAEIGNSIKELTLPLLLTRFSALLQLSLLRCRKASQAGVPGEVNCGAAVLAALPLPDLPGPEVAKGNLRAARPAQVLGSTGCGRGAPSGVQR